MTPISGDRRGHRQDRSLAALRQQQLGHAPRARVSPLREPSGTGAASAIGVTPPELIELRLRCDQCEPSLAPQLVQLVWGRVPCDQSGNEDSGVEDNPWTEQVTQRRVEPQLGSRGWFHAGKGALARARCPPVAAASSSSLIQPASASLAAAFLPHPPATAVATATTADPSPSY